MELEAMPSNDIYFSVSMPVHNAEKFLSEAIESVLKQNYNNFELILVNDHSTDNSLEICMEIAARDSRVKLFESNGKGSLLARRDCIRHSNGEYLYIMDSDDYLTDANAMAEWNKIINDSHCDLLIFNAVNEKNTCFDGTPFQKGKVIEGKDRVFIYDLLSGRGTINVLWDKVFSRKLVDHDETPYIEHQYLSHGTDFFQSIVIISNAERIKYTDKCYYYYRPTPGSITHKYNNKMLLSAKAIIDRRDEISKGWIIQPENVEQNKSYATLCEYCTVINKLRLANINKEEAIQIFEDIHNDWRFKNSYKCMSLLPAPKRAIVYMIKKKRYLILYVLLKCIHEP